MARPVKTFKHKENPWIEIAAWPMRSDAKKVTFSIKKTYKEKATGEYKPSTVWFESDIQALFFLCQQVNMWLKDYTPEQEPDEETGF